MISSSKARYKRLRRKNRKKLVKAAKKFREYDFCFLHRNFMACIDCMYDYFSSGDNVWQTDDTRLEIVEQLEHVRELNSAIGNDSLEPDLYKELYSYVGEKILYWWD